MKWLSEPRAYICGGILAVVGLIMGLVTLNDSDGYLYKTGIMLWMLGASWITTGLIDRHRHRVWKKHPDQEKQYEIGQTDERNIAIRGQASYASWFITLFVLFAVLAVFLILNQTLAAWLTGTAMLLHIVGFHVAGVVYSRRM